MAQPAPIAVLNADRLELQWPDNKVRLDLASGSSDASIFEKNQIKVFELNQTAGPKPLSLIQVSNGIWDVEFPEVFAETKASFLGTVTDGARKPLSDSDSISIVLKPALVQSIFAAGASGPTIDSVNTLRVICGEGAPSRTTTWIQDYTSGGKRELETFINAKHPMFWNVNWKHPIKDATGKHGVPFPIVSELNFYEDKVNQILSFYKGHPAQDLIIPVPFNEPTTDNFHDGPMSDYIAAVKVFVRVAKENGFKRITDGGVHIGTILGANDGDPNSTNKSQQVAYLLDEYAKIPDLTWINAHTTNIGTLYTAQDIPDAQNKCVNITGRKLCSNEFHVKNWEAVVGVMTGWYMAGVPYCVYISGTDPNYILNSGTSLTRIGEEFKKFIDSKR